MRADRGIARSVLLRTVVLIVITLYPFSAFSDTFVLRARRHTGKFSTAYGTLQGASAEPRRGQPSQGEKVQTTLLALYLRATLGHRARARAGARCAAHGPWMLHEAVPAVGRLVVLAARWGLPSWRLRLWRTDGRFDNGTARKHHCIPLEVGCERGEGPAKEVKRLEALCCRF